MSLNNAYSTNKQGRRFLTQIGRNYKDEIGWAARWARKSSQDMFKAPIRVEMVFYLKSRHRIDIDNLMKLPIDAMTGICWKDDSEIVEIFGKKVFGDPRPRTEINIFQLNSTKLNERR